MFLLSSARPCLLSTFFMTFGLACLNGCGSGSGSGNPPTTPDFTISISPSTLSVAVGAKATFQVSVQPSGGFSGSVTLDGVLPAGLTVSPSLPVTLPTGTAQTFTVTCAPDATIGKYNLILPASSGSLRHLASAAVSVVVPFSLSITPSTVSLNAGATGSFQVSLQPVYGFTGSAQVQLSGLPSNTTVTPTSPFTVSTGTAQTVTVATSTTTAASSNPLTLQATFGSTTVWGSATLNVQNTSPPPSRADYVFTGDTPSGAAYDQKRHQVYVSNPLAGTVDVLSSTTYQILRRIPVPSPRGVDITPDNSIVFIGTGTDTIGTGMTEVFAIDTASMAITARYAGPAFGITPVSYPESPLNPFATPDNCALIGVNGSIIKWNPVSGQSTTVLSNSPVDISYSSPFSNTPYSVAAHSADHTRVIISNNDYPSTVWLYDTQKNQFIQQATIQGEVYSVAANPTGTQFAVAWSSESGGAISFLDSSMNTTANVSGGGYVLYSSDGSRLYVTGVVGAVPAVFLLNSSTYEWSGSAPSMGINVPHRSPITMYTSPMAADETGRIFGQNLYGVAIDDATDLRNYTGNEFYPAHLAFVAPNSAPLNVSQSVQMATDSFSQAPGIWFGPLPAQDTSIASFPYATTNAPASSQLGVVNVRLLAADGVQAWVPHAYTYGAQLADGPDIAAASDGSTAINLYGFGIRYDAPFGSTGTGPAATVSFGGVPGRVLPDSRPGPLDFSLSLVQVQAPQMPLGQADLTATYNGSSTTLASAYHAIQVGTYALDGTASSLAYDPRRNQVYLAVTDHVDVFSLSSSQFLAPIQIPVLNGKKQLAGIGMTPDGSKLLIVNQPDNSVAVIDPDNPGTATAFNTGGFFRIMPVSNSLAYLQGAPPSDLWQLDLQTMATTPVYFEKNVVGGNYMATSPDGVYLCTTGSNNGPTSLYNLAAGTLSTGPISSNQGASFCAIDGGVVVSASQNRGAMPQINDLGMRTVAVASLRDYEYVNDLLAPSMDLLGIGIDHTGSLMYAPWGQEIAIFDTYTGEYRERIALPYPLLELPPGSMIIDQTGKQIFLASQKGLTVLQLDSLPLAIGKISESGGTWAITGTGFVSGTSISVDGTGGDSAYIDANHLALSGAPALSSVHLIKITNPDGHSYTYDAAYLR